LLATKAYALTRCGGMDQAHKGSWPDRLAGLDAFLACRAVTLDYAQDALNYHAAPLRALGLLDAAAHTDRHLAQMQGAVGST
jgi:hypothetical protein